MAALFPKIYDVIDKNPSKTTTLRYREPTATEGFQTERWDIFWTTPLDPPGPLSLLLLATDPLYQMASTSLRKQLLTETLLTLHVRVDTELVGRRFPRKKIQDLLAGQISANAPVQSALVEEVLCELYQVQKILVNRKAKALSFVPSDPRLWHSDRPILVTEDENCWRYTPAQTVSLSDWVQQKEEEGWTVRWPTADGKLEDVKQMLLQKGNHLDGKQKKEDLAQRLGRLQAFETLHKISLSPVE
jgi:hypothetical protein